MILSSSPRARARGYNMPSRWDSSQGVDSDLTTAIQRMHPGLILCEIAYWLQSEQVQMLRQLRAAPNVHVTGSMDLFSLTHTHQFDERL